MRAAPLPAQQGQAAAPELLAASAQELLDLPLGAGIELPFDLPLMLPDLRVHPSAMQIFMFSAVTWNRHHIHYNADAARAEGHPDVVVQRSLIGNYFARHTGAWLGAAGRVACLSWRVTGSAVPDQGLCCHGVVRERLDCTFQPAHRATASVPLRYQGWLTADDGREVASAEGVLCIHATF